MKVIWFSYLCNGSHTFKTTYTVSVSLTKPLKKKGDEVSSFGCTGLYSTMANSMGVKKALVSSYRLSRGKFRQ